MDFWVPTEPVGCELDGEPMLVACKDPGVNHLCRDWRGGGSDRQIHVPASWDTPYLRMRLANTQANLKGVKLTIADLPRVGGTAYVVLAGPSVVRNLEENPPRDGDIVVGVNSGGAWFNRVMKRPLDYFLLADGSITSEMCDRLWGGIPEYKAMAACIWVNPDMVPRGTEKPVYWYKSAGLGHENSYCGIPPDMPSLEYSYNTGSMVLHFCDRLGVSEIVLVGADYALTEGMFHVGERAGWNDHKNVIAAPDMHGNITLCRPDQFISARKLETWAWMLQKYGVTVRNLTGAGILHRFMQLER